MGYSYLNISQKNLEIITHASIFQLFLSNEFGNWMEGIWTKNEPILRGEKRNVSKVLTEESDRWELRGRRSVRETGARREHRENM